LSKIRLNKKDPKPIYKSAILVNTVDSFYFVYAYGNTINEIIRETVDVLKQWDHREPEIFRAYYSPNSDEKQDITPKIKDLTNKALNGG
tara:strand:- start:585 stop:851 length:267 start_codon:yes stop_codon:yes gene_type:complete